jgi:hypothetical protein
MAAVEVEVNESGAPVRSDQGPTQVQALHGLPFADLMFQARSVHRDNFACFDETEAKSFRPLFALVDHENHILPG